MEINPAHSMIRIGRFANRIIRHDICLGLLLAVLAPGVFALGLGEIRVTSKLGEHFVGRIPLIASPGESIDASCFKLLNDSPNKQDGIPFLETARLTVNTGNGVPYIRVSSRKRVSELIVRLAIKSGCESENTREYTILLDLPNSETAAPEQAVINEPVTESAPPSRPVPPRAAREIRLMGPEVEVVAGDTLSGIAASLYPNSQRKQRKFIRRAVSENPEVLTGKAPDALLPEGALLRVPDLNGPARKPVNKEAVRTETADVLPQPEKAPDTPPVKRKSAKAAKSGDGVDVRLKLTTSDLDVSASGNVTEGEREILREKQRILMDMDDMAAYNLSLNHRLKDMETHIQELNAKLDALVHQRSETAVRPAAATVHLKGTQPEPRKSTWAWSEYTHSMIFAAGGLGLLAVLYLMWRRKRAEADALMELDVDLGSDWDDVPEAKPSVLSSSVPVNAEVQPDPAVASVAVPAPARPASPAEIQLPQIVAEHIEDVALGSIECAIEEANIYIALGEVGRAIANLKFQINSEPGSPVDLWLKLLEIYHDQDMQPEFDKLAAEFHQHFNIEKPTWEKMAYGVVSSSSIEQFPHLLEKITSFWGSVACLEYLNYLLLDNKGEEGGLREGFELGIASDILLLIRLLEMRGKFDGLPVEGAASPENLGPLEFVFEPGISEPRADDADLSHDDEGMTQPDVEASPSLELELVPHIVESKPEVVVQPDVSRTGNWRELLASCRDADNRDEFDAFVRELSQNSGVPAQSWDQVTAAAKNTLGIEHFPSLAREITALWGTTECRTYLRQLLLDVRDGKRKGFDLGVSKEILLLLFILERELGGGAVSGQPAGRRGASGSVKPAGASAEAGRSDLGLPVLDLDKLPVPESAAAAPVVPKRTAPVDPRSGLEKRYRRIVESLTLLWGEPEAKNFLESLVADYRGGREGFDAEVIAELMLLFSITGAVTEEIDEHAPDIWGLSGEKELLAQNALKPRKR